MWSNLPNILAEAAKSPLGISALVILVLAFLAYGLFRRENSKIKVRIFLFIFIGFIAAAITIIIIENMPENLTESSQEAAYLLYLGDEYALSEMNDEAEKRYFQARDIYKKDQNEIGIATALFKLGKLELENNNKAQALEYLRSAQSLFEDSNDLIGKNNVVSSINMINRDQKGKLKEVNAPEFRIARNTSELARYLSYNSELSIENSEKIVDTFFDGITKTLAAGHEVRIVGFGTFSVAHRAFSQGRNPRTGELIQIPASIQPKFKAGKVLKDAVNK